MNTGLLLALLGPIILAVANVLDKYVISKRVKNTSSYYIIDGWAYIVIGIILAFSLDWSNTTGFIFPFVTGILISANILLYFKILEKEDISSMLGLMFLYPIPVAILSVFLFDEKIALIGYIGMILSALGATFLGLRFKKIKLETALWFIIALILILVCVNVLNEYTTNHMQPIQAIAIEAVTIGLIIQLALFTKARKNVFKELKNTGWAFLSSSMTNFGVLLILGAFALLPATIATGLTVIQPMAALFLESLVDKKVSIVKDKNFFAKLIPITMISVGVLLLYLGA